MHSNKRLISILAIFFASLLGVMLMTMKPSEIFGKNLILKSGVVSGLETDKYLKSRPNTEEFNEHMKSYTYVAKFYLDGNTPLLASFNFMPEINEGDRIRVSGLQKASSFEVIAFRNETRQVTVTRSWKTSLIAATLFSIFSAFIFFFVIKEPRVIEQIIFVGFIGLGLFLIARSMMIKEALEMLGPN
jgi:hypothetical protein